MWPLKFKFSHTVCFDITTHSEMVIFLHHSLLSKLCLPKSQFYWFYINNCKFWLSSYTGSLWYFAYAFQIPVSIKTVKIRTYTSSHLSVLPPIAVDSEKDETIEEDRILHFKLYGGGYFCPFIFSKCLWNYKKFLNYNYKSKYLTYLLLCPS